MLFSCGIIFGGSPRDAGVTQNCVAFPQIALPCGATFLQRIPLTASISTNYHVVPEIHFPLRSPPQWVEKRYVCQNRKASHRKTATLLFAGLISRVCDRSV